MATPEVPGRVSPRPAASRITAKESTLIDFLNKDSGLRLEKKRLEARYILVIPLAKMMYQIT
jgi:hypothetical protein